MRILHVSDLHYSLRQFDWVVEVAPEFDLIVVSGDQLDLASSVPLTVQIEVVRGYLSLMHDAGRVVVSSGNHDLTGPDDHGEQAALWLSGVRDAGIPTDGDSLEVDDVLVTVCPWWDGPIGREAVMRHLAADAARRPRTWIWVYHWPPVGSPTTWTGKRFYGDTDLPAWIDEHRPDFVLAGHVHQPPFTPDGAWADRLGPTWVFNPGTQRGPVPAFVEIDLTDGYASWTSQMGREELALSATERPERTVF